MALPGRDTPGGMGDPQGLASVRAGGVSPAKGNGDAALPTPPTVVLGCPYGCVMSRDEFRCTQLCLTLINGN